MKNNKYQISNTKYFKKRGIALIWSLLISTIILIMAFTSAVLAIKEMRIASNTDESHRAYTAAEAGIEKAMYEAKVAGEENQTNRLCDDAYQKALLGNLADKELYYESKFICSGGFPEEIESTGISKNTTTRKLKVTMIPTAPNEIDTFDNSTGLAGNFISFNPKERDPDYGIPNKDFIMQQFDLANFNDVKTGENGITVGMTNDGNTAFGVNFKKIEGQVEITLAGTINAENITPVGTFRITANDSKYYRVQLEYARYGSFAFGYTVVRTKVMERELFDSIDTGDVNVRYKCVNQLSTIYAGVPKRGESVSKVITNSGTWDASGSIKVGNDVMLDNMVFWGR